MTAPRAYVEAELTAIEGWLKEGRSATQIAEAFLGRFHRAVTRNGIIGIVTRNKRLKAVGFARAGAPRKARLRPAAAPEQPCKKAAKAVVSFGYLRARDMARDLGETEFDDDTRRAFVPPRPRPARAQPVDPMAYDTGSRRLPLMALRPGQCRFPVNDAGPGEAHLFCGHRAEAGRPYCVHHRARATGVGTAGERSAADFALKLGRG